MDLRQVEYIVKIAEEKSITKAAEKLYVTQSALNQQLLKLEKELDSQIFYRSRTEWALTPVGEVYIENAKKLLRIKKETYDQISDITEKHDNHLTIGLTAERGISMFAEVYPKFYELYPNVTVEPMEMNVKQQQEMIYRGKIDIGFVTLIPEQRTADHYTTIFSERILLAVPVSHPLAYRGKRYGEELEEIDLKLFKDDTFVLLTPDTTIRKIVDPIFAAAGFKPKLLFETRSSQTLYRMTSDQLTCTLISETYAKDDGKTVYFLLPQRPVWDICVTYRKGAYLSKAAKGFIELAKKYWKK